ncbi:MAG: hypothetical protein BWX88_05335 [Planctomycetes bacterium ADurb.Bin126]|nr:MAG: hypothetical protein BWX88_05335 [Planctomycetes bacterium ADurb.Bin126]
MYSVPATARRATQGAVITKVMVSPEAHAVLPAVTVKDATAWLKALPTVPVPMEPVTEPDTSKVVAAVRVTVMVSWTDAPVPIRPVIRPLPVPV